ncbi:MAG: class I SAM-dependent methyltransferase [Candidatus Lokiarchaeota archaeon]|nr:class I SAM-dependent methyltransferase [Candidatus Lokiarchaeota archaeon]
MQLSILNKLGDKIVLDSDFISKIIQSLNMPHDSRILDIGTGWGKMAILLALHGYNVITGEPNKWAEWENNAKIAGVFEKINYQRIDAQKLDFSDGNFDYVFLLGSLHHIPDKDRVFNEILRVLTQEGKIILFDYTKKRIEQISKNSPYHPPAVHPRSILNSLSVSYQYIIDDKNEIFCFLIEKN